MDDKYRILLTALREAAVIVVAAIEECLDVPLDRSALHKRRAKTKE